MTAPIPAAERLRMIEVYAPVQGESTFVGLPCVFVRLAGCNLRCTWCDSAWTFTGGTHRSIDDVVEEACGFGIDLVEVTGGEPLVHKQAIPLMERLVARGKTVLLETSGRPGTAGGPRDPRPQAARQRRGRVQPLVEHPQAPPERRGEGGHRLPP